MLKRKIIWTLKRTFTLDNSGNDLGSPLYHFYQNKVNYKCYVCETENTFDYTLDENKSVKCTNCGASKKFKKGKIQSLLKILKGHKTVFFTRATLTELWASINNNPNQIYIRPHLKYHTDFNCEFAHRDYIKGGRLIAYNSGVIKGLNEPRLSICNGCLGEIVEKCPRCRGVGYIPVYNHIQAGICFKCWGDGFVIEQKKETE